VSNGRRITVSETSLSFAIETEVAPAYFDDLLNFVLRQYILVHQERFRNAKRTTVGGEQAISFTALEPERGGYLDIEMRSGEKVQVKMVQRDGTLPRELADQIRDDLIDAIQFFEEQMRASTLYFAWVEGKEVIPEKPPQRQESIVQRLFSESMLWFFVVFIAASIVLFAILGPYAPLALVFFQFLMVFFSDKIIARTGDWYLTKENPNVHLLQYQLPFQAGKGLPDKVREDLLLQIKREIYERTLAVGKLVECETAGGVLSRYGFECRPENMSTKTVNVYEIVKRMAERYGLPIPKIVIANILLPNAAASGPSPSRGVVLITTGLLVQLDEDEILNVLGHEFSHLKRRDPLVLFGVTSAEYLLRIYVFLPFLLTFWLLYFIFALGAVFFIAKFFESRADLESAIVLGEPQVLAEALRKIGFRRLQLERVPSFRIQEWIGWDPHPPLYFRIARMEKLKDPKKVKHPFIQSIKDNIRGFREALF
jgi:heat shock protein HtpX